MKRMVVRYKTKAETTDENQRLVERVFDELRAKSPEGLHYASMRLGDGTFLHFVAVEDESAGTVLPGLEAFRSFQAGIRERCLEPPHFEDATIVGNYRMLSD